MQVARLARRGLLSSEEAPSRALTLNLTLTRTLTLTLTLALALTPT